MRKFQSLRTIGLAAVALFAHSALEAQQSTVLDDIRYLADDRLEGRLTGSPGADSAAAYLARRFEAAGLVALPGGWFQPFTVSASAPAVHGTDLGGAAARNVVGILPGRDPARRGEVIVIGAHYDHLGMGITGSLSPNERAIHNGADDNASGSAALVEIARRLAANRPARSVLFVAFSGEELGLLGSAWYTGHAPMPLDSTVAMVNLDMVGRLRNDKLIVYGVETAKEFRSLLDTLNQAAGFDLHAQGDGYGPSDHSSFYAAGRPVLHFFTDLHEDYHRPTDDWQKINVPGLVKVAAFTADLVRDLGNRRGPLTFVNVPRPAPVATSGSGYGAYLGTIPDMTDNPGGVRISGVGGGSPAEKAGLTAGDVILRIGDHDVTDLMAMTVALRAYKPGDTVTIRFRRGEEIREAQATLGARGG